VSAARASAKGTKVVDTDCRRRLILGEFEFWDFWDVSLRGTTGGWVDKSRGSSVRLEAEIARFFGNACDCWLDGAVIGFVLVMNLW
jgi:hypothetical protein